VHLKLLDRDRRGYNLPTADEIAVLLPDNRVATSNRDVTLKLRQGANVALQRINQLSAYYDPLRHVLLFLSVIMSMALSSPLSKRRPMHWAFWKTIKNGTVLCLTLQRLLYLKRFEQAWAWIILRMISFTNEGAF